MTTNIIVPSGAFFPAPVRTPIYADKDALKKGEMSRPWVHWFQSLGGGGKRVDQAVAGISSAPIFGPCIFADFTDQNFWAYHFQPWIKMVPSTTNLVFTPTGTSAETACGMVPVSAMMFRPHIYPDVNGEIDLTMRIVPVVGTRLSTGSFTCGFTFFDLPDQAFGLWGAGSYPSTYSNYISQFYTATGDGTTVSNYVGDDYNAITTVDIKFKMAPGDPTLSSSYNKWTQQRSFNGGTWTTIVFGGGPPTYYSRKSTLKGIQIGVGCGGSRLGKDFQFTVSAFTLVKGIAYPCLGKAGMGAVFVGPT